MGDHQALQDNDGDKQHGRSALTPLTSAAPQKKNKFWGLFGHLTESRSVLHLCAHPHCSPWRQARVSCCRSAASVRPSSHMRFFSVDLFLLPINSMQSSKPPLHPADSRAECASRRPPNPPSRGSSILHLPVGLVQVAGVGQQAACSLWPCCFPFKAFSPATIPSRQFL